MDDIERPSTGLVRLLVIDGAENDSARDVSQCLRRIIVRNTLGTEEGINEPGPMHENEDVGVHHE